MRPLSLVSNGWVRWQFGRRPWEGRWGEERESPGVIGLLPLRGDSSVVPTSVSSSIRVQRVPLYSFRGCGCPPRGAHPPRTRYWWAAGIEQRPGERVEACRFKVQSGFQFISSVFLAGRQCIHRAAITEVREQEIRLLCPLPDLKWTRSFRPLIEFRGSKERM